MKSIAIIVLIAVLVAAGFIATRKFNNSKRGASQQGSSQQYVTPRNQQDQSDAKPKNEQIPIQNRQPEPQPDTLTVRAPRANAEISSPMRISGEAKNWYFEGTFPVKVIDLDGREIGRGTARALGDWTVNDFVPFEGSINFNPGSQVEGWVVFEKDNPSGLAQNDLSYRIPVKFSPRD